MWRRAPQRGQPKIVYHRPRWRGRGGYSTGDKLRFVAAGGFLLLVVWYLLKLFVFAEAAAGSYSVWLPLVVR
jgi:hypothetical protein